MKNRVLKTILIIAGVLVIGIAGLLVYVKTALPDVGPAPEVTLAKDSATIERGKYLANHVAVCMDCHSKRDWTKFSGPLVSGTEGMGGETFDQKFGFPGAFYSRNITPAGVGKWTDGELMRAVTCGVSKDGRALFPVMPHPAYGRADQEDIKAILAYIRTLAPIQNEVPETAADFPMNFIINTIPQKANFSPKPEKTDVLEYGKYLVNMAACVECHTIKEKGQNVPGMEFAGGMEFPMEFGLLRSPNITPDNETGIGYMQKADFIRKFKNYADSSAKNMPVQKGAYNTIMPWTMYAGMTEEDLGAIYEYIHSIKPISHKVERVVMNQQ